MGKEIKIQIKLQERGEKPLFSCARMSKYRIEKKLSPASGFRKTKKKQADNTAILNIALIELLDDQVGVHRLNQYD